MVSPIPPGRREVAATEAMLREHEGYPFLLVPSMVPPSPPARWIESLQGFAQHESVHLSPPISRAPLDPPPDRHNRHHAPIAARRSNAARRRRVPRRRATRSRPMSESDDSVIEQLQAKRRRPRRESPARRFPTAAPAPRPSSRRLRSWLLNRSTANPARCRRNNPTANAREAQIRHQQPHDRLRPLSRQPKHRACSRVPAPPM